MAKVKVKKPKRVANLVREGDMDDNFNAQNFNIAKASHPIACIFHVMFKGAAAGS